MSRDALKFSFAFILPAVVMAISAAYFDRHIWIWLVFWVVIATLFGLFEVIAVNVTKKKTLSRRFWEFKDKHPIMAGIWLLTFMSFFIYLGLHLWSRL